jgi:hypothetical protein
MPVGSMPSGSAITWIRGYPWGSRINTMSPFAPVVRRFDPPNIYPLPGLNRL